MVDDWSVMEQIWDHCFEELEEKAKPCVFFFFFWTIRLLLQPLLLDSGGALRVVLCEGRGIGPVFEWGGRGILNGGGTESQQGAVLFLFSTCKGVFSQFFLLFSDTRGDVRDVFRKVQPESLLLSNPGDLFIYL